MDFTYWYLLPVAVVIAGVANGAGIGGATFFSPLFVLALGLEPQVAIGTALVTEVFGFGSGLVAHAGQGAID
ncbi:MAG: sulfite exporter TauE/SafE family protein, partial [Acidimicrobiia bacterium]